jgi:hypothetical protein
LPGGVAPTNAISQLLKQLGANEVVEQGKLQFTSKQSGSDSTRMNAFLVVAYSHAQNSIAVGYTVAEPGVESAALESLKSRMRKLSLFQ